MTLMRQFRFLSVFLSVVLTLCSIDWSLAAAASMMTAQTQCPCHGMTTCCCQHHSMDGATHHACPMQQARQPQTTNCSLQPVGCQSSPLAVSPGSQVDKLLPLKRASYELVKSVATISPAYTMLVSQVFLDPPFTPPKTLLA